MSGRSGAVEEREVVVVGAGPAGCAAAILLRRLGHDVLLLDEARFPRDKICGEAVSPGACRLLRLLGLEERVRALGPHRLKGMILVAPDGTTVRGDYRGREGLAVRRLDLDAALVRGARAAGVEVREALRVTDLLHGGDGMAGVAVAQVRAGGECGRSGDAGERGGGAGDAFAARRGDREAASRGDGRNERIGARLVVGADGRRSVVARRLGLLQPHPRFRKFAVRGYWENTEGLEERGEMHVGGGGYCGIAPLTHSLANVTFVLDRREMHGASRGLEAFYRGAIERRWPRIAERLHRAELQDAPRAIGPLAVAARRVSAPGVLLVGDAAGFYDPFTGEGIALALRSAEMAAVVASSALAAGSTADLCEYDARRRAATRAKFRFNHLVQEVVRRPRLADLLARRLRGRPALADRLVQAAGDIESAGGVLAFGFVSRLLVG